MQTRTKLHYRFFTTANSAIINLGSIILQPRFFSSSIFGSKTVYMLWVHGVIIKIVSKLSLDIYSVV